MTENRELLWLNLRYYESLLTRGSATYPPEVARKLFDDAKARLTRAEDEASNRLR